jgi:hypothetical protein
MFVAVLTSLLLQANAAQGVPAELKAALAARQFQNAQITWEALTGPPNSQFRSWGVATYVGDQVAHETHYPDNPPNSSMVDHTVFRGLYWEGGLLENEGDALTARLLTEPRMGNGVLMDYRVLGMHARTSTAPEYNPFEVRGDATPAYSVTKRDGLAVVSAVERAAERVFERRWSIDPQSGWNVILYEEVSDGRPTLTVGTKLAKTGEYWFPQEVEYRNPDGPYATFRIREVKLNNPNLPKRLMPEFIEVVPGTNIYRMFPDAPPEAARFDGERIIGVEEFKRRRRAGEIQRGEAFVRDLARGPEILAQQRAGEKYTPSEWEKFVARFIAEHNLDNGQGTRAWSIYRDCRDSADQYLKKHKEEFDELDKGRAALKFTPNADQSAKLAARAAELRRPVQEIFDEQLVPRLDKLLTREQRALSHPTSEPVAARPASS